MSFMSIKYFNLGITLLTLASNVYIIDHSTLFVWDNGNDYKPYGAMQNLQTVTVHCEITWQRMLFLLVNISLTILTLLSYPSLFYVNVLM